MNIKELQTWLQNSDSTFLLYSSEFKELNILETFIYFSFDVECCCCLVDLLFYRSKSAWTFVFIQTNFGENRGNLLFSNFMVDGNKIRFFTVQHIYSFGFVFCLLSPIRCFFNNEFKKAYTCILRWKLNVKVDFWCLFFVQT